ncbi:hypothetical protein E1211_15375 [Micromonospora sp. 15K316]|uniref:hypothetical protein n=1 Tax=unclassified Micromonospora TaxID=2617518 RepID=UPI001051DCCD|nr:MULTISPECIES: hypothetical protein [unclassified Micromonospora]TDB71812.1 hypothetical protein E1165_22050 [Micromonospora sp. KC723]TDC35684.1 hypothetical protein E1211_15375 [Micromonospora sp. 15K316]
MATTSLLANPVQVGQIRDLIRYARKVGAEHATYASGPDVTGQGYGPVEHVWDLPNLRVSLYDGQLEVQRYKQIAGVRCLRGSVWLRANDVVSVGEVARLLFARGILPMPFGDQIDVGPAVDR